MIIRTIVKTLVILALVAKFACAADISDVKKQLATTFPNMSVEEVNQTGISGVYEVNTGANIFYYAPESGRLLFGEMWDVKGKNLTAEQKPKIEAFKRKRAKELFDDLLKNNVDKAVKIGSGKHVVIEFTDPDCPYCRKMDAYWKTRDDVTRYAFLTPLDMHPEAPAKAKYILAANDKTAAFEEVYSGMFDSSPVPAVKGDASAALEFHRGISIKSGIKGAPAYFVDGVFVSGANVGAVEKVIGSKEVQK